MSLPGNDFYRFGRFQLNPSERLLLRSGRPVPLPPKAFDTLLLLVRNGGHVVSKEDLMRSLWPGTFVEENNLTQHISTLRRILGESPHGGSYIETVPRLGYRFASSVIDAPENGQTEVVLRRYTRAHFSLTEQEEEILEEAPDEPLAPAACGSPRDWLDQEPQPKRALTAIALCLIASAIAVMLTASFLLYRRSVQPTERLRPFDALKFIRLTTSGKAENAAISSDGKYVAYVFGDPGHQSLWLHQVATQSDLQLVPPAPATYSGIAFSRDGNFVYYTAYGTDPESMTAFRVPTLGGEPRKVADRVFGAVTLSPNQRQIAFVRRPEQTSAQELIIAGSDGGGERTIATAHAGQYGFAAPAWSPDGKVIAAAVWRLKGSKKSLGVWMFELESGKESLLGRQNWTDIEGLAWLTDGRHLLVSGSDTASGPAAQIWELSFPAGQYRRITNDLSDYGDVSVTADSQSLVTVATQVPANIWVAPAQDPDAGRWITSGSVGFGGWTGLTWTPDRKLVFISVAGGNQELWAMQADGTHPAQLTSTAGWKLQPSACSEGRAVLFTVVSGAASDIWKVDVDGSSLKQLTYTGDAEDPACSADGQWAVFPADHRLWKVPIQGGSPSELSDYHVGQPVLSPDGKWIACAYFFASHRTEIAILPAEGGPPAKTIALRRATSLAISTEYKVQWTPNAKALAYVDVRNGASNLWIQPLDGSPPNPLTHFQTGRIFSFSWSRDGRLLALTRGTISSDVIVITNLH